MFTQRPSDLALRVPVRSCASKTGEGGETVLVRERYREGWRARLLGGLFGDAAERTRLDEVGTAVWAAIDGRRTVKEIGDLMAREHGADFDKGRMRLALFLETMHAHGYIIWRDEDTG